MNSYNNQTVSYLNQYLGTIAVLTNNMQNYHWNLVGPNFFPLHAKFQEYYERGQDETDSIAERIKQLGGFPITSLRGYQDASGIKSADSKSITGDEAVRGTINDFKYVHKMGSDLASYAASIGDGVTSGSLGNFLAYLEKQLWMLEANIR